MSQIKDPEKWARVKPLWLEALRSGRYKQGRGFLRVGDEFCCLGVLCDLHDPTAWRGPASGAAAHLGHARVPANSVLEWAGLGDEYNPSAQGKPLTEHNDSGKTFAEIADMIERLT